MTPVAGFLLLASYLVGAVPFGYLVGRLKGVDLFRAGSGNIGATNAARVLGRKFGVLVFVLDFLKGAVPVAAVGPAAAALDPSGYPGPPEVLRVGAALAAFLGHLFPVYLGFRGGKGVATGTGAVAVLVPVPAAAAALTWAVVVLATRFVSLGSVAGVVAMVAARLATAPDPFGPGSWVVTAFCFVGAGLVVVKHLGNIRRLFAGTESRIGDGPMRQTLLRGLHVLALGMWFGGAAFFNFVVAPLIFESFREVVSTAPSDRTAYVAIVPDGTDDDRRADLARALAGSAVGPIFPRYFLWQGVCWLAAAVTAFVWMYEEPWRAVHRWRAGLLAVAGVLVIAGWPLSGHVSRLRVERFSPDPAVATAAKEGFGPWHLASLGTSAVTTLLAGVCLALAARMPERSGS